MQSLLVVAAGLAIGWLPIAALDSAIPKSAVPYNGEALRTAIADGLSRAGRAPLVGTASGAAGGRD